MSPTSRPDERLGVWRKQRPLACVPSGQWWRVVHSLGQQPALALVYAETADAGAVLLRMAQSEGQPWTDAALAWPLDAGLTADGRPYVVMPASEGEPLLTAMTQASLRRRLGWLRQLAHLLQQAREHGLALVELDPSLLWLDHHQHLRLQALALVREDAATQRLGSLQGELCAAARPLQAPQTPGGQPGDESSQVYALGMLMCLLVNGRLPGDPQPPAAPVAMLSQWLSLNAVERSSLDALLHQAVDADPAQRPADLQTFIDVLDAWLDQANALPPTQPGALDGPTAPKPAPLLAPSMPLPPPAPPPPPAFAPAWQPGALAARRGAGRWRTAGLALLLLALGVAAAWWTGRS